jgi:PAS domain S-box-containing protein
MQIRGDTAPPATAADADEDITVVHLDDDEAFLALAADRVEHASDRVRVHTASDPSAALERLGRGDVDCVVSDYQMPGMDGLEFLEAVRERHPELPFLLFTGQGNEAIAGRAISAGVTDYLRKGTSNEQFTVLANRIENTVSKRRAEHKARATDRRIREVHERITDAVVAVDEEWCYTYVNTRAAEVLERSRGTLLGQRLWDAFPALCDTEFEPAIREAMASQQTTTVEDYVEPKAAWYEATVYPDEDGVSVYFRDVTERRERARDLHEERAFNDAVLGALPDILYAFDQSGEFLRWNDRLEEVTGYDAHELSSMTPFDLVPPDEREPVGESVTEVFEDRESGALESVLCTRDGERIPYEFTGAILTDADDDPVGLVGVGRDRSARQERERRFEAIFDNTYQFTGLAEPDGTLLEANETALEFGGVDRETVVGEPVWETPWFAGVPERVSVAEAAVERAAEGEFVRDELEVQGAEDRAVVDFSVRPIHDADGEVELLVIEGRDITELKTHEAELERQNERLEEFAGVLSHDLRNRLGVAEGRLTLAREDPNPASIDHALTAVDRMGDLVEDILSLASEGRVVDDPEPVDVRIILGKAVSNVRTDGAEVTVDCSGGCTVLADPNRLSELVENLVGNAVIHARADPTVRVAVEGERLLVEDDGPGVAPEHREEIFEPGHTTSDDGTGFGLAIVQRIAAAHDWSVHVESSPLGGARFVVDGLERA